MPAGLTNKNKCQITHLIGTIKDLTMINLSRPFFLHTDRPRENKIIQYNPRCEERYFFELKTG